MDGQIAPQHQGFRQPDDPFPEDASLYVTVNQTQLTADNIQVIRHKPKYNNLESFDAFKATKEQIFSFEARVMTYELALCVALVEKMDEALETDITHRPEWKARLRKLLPELVQTYQDSKNLCDFVGKTVDTPATDKPASANP